MHSYLSKSIVVVFPAATRSAWSLHSKISPQLRQMQECEACLLLFHIIRVQPTNWSTLQNLRILLPHREFTALPQTKKIATLCSKPVPVWMFQLGQLGFSLLSYTMDWHLLEPRVSWQFHVQLLHKARANWNITDSAEWAEAVCEPSPAIPPLPQICSRTGGQGAKFLKCLLLKMPKVYSSVFSDKKQDEGLPYWKQMLVKFVTLSCFAALRTIPWSRLFFRQKRPFQAHCPSHIFLISPPMTNSLYLLPVWLNINNMKFPISHYKVLYLLPVLYLIFIFSAHPMFLLWIKKKILKVR